MMNPSNLLIFKSLSGHSPDKTKRKSDDVALNPADLTAKSWKVGDAAILTAVAHATGSLVADDSVPSGSISFGPLLQASCGVQEGEVVELKLAEVTSAKRIVFTIAGRVQPTGNNRRNGNHSILKPLSRISEIANQLGINNGDKTEFSHLIKSLAINRVFVVGSLLDYEGTRLRVIETDSEGVVLITQDTKVDIIDRMERRASYQDVGGLSNELARIREMVELPLKNPELFEQLGVDAPRGLLLYGPPGCGKTLIARTVAQQTDAFFLLVNAPEIIQKHYGESEEMLRNVFEEAQEHETAILFIDEIDAIAPNRETVLGEVEKRVVGQLLALMDGVSSRGKIVVMAATNLPNNVDPALRRPGRFDREIAITPPNKAGRLEILKIHSRFMPLAANADLERIAAITHGFFGADLAALCREAGMICVRDRSITEADASLFVRMEHFQEALANFHLSSMREMATDVPETHWEDIGGLTEQKRLLKQSIEWPLIYGDRFHQAGAHIPSGILLTGDSGTGKTLLGQAVGTTTEVNFIVARGPELLSKWVGESERGIREVFRRARQSAPSIIFFDEIDTIVPTRGQSTGDGQISDRMVGQFLLEFDAISNGEAGVVVLAATNRPDLIDPALLRPGRFDLILDLPAPDRESRLSILQVHCQQVPLGTDVDLPTLADASEGLNGAHLAAMCQQAKMHAIKDSVEAQPNTQAKVLFQVKGVHFEKALSNIMKKIYPVHQAT